MPRDWFAGQFSQRLLTEISLLGKPCSKPTSKNCSLLGERLRSNLLTKRKPTSQHRRDHQILHGRVCYWQEFAKKQAHMKNLPLVEILIPTYNRCASLERALQSAHSQDYPNISILVSNNGSTDGTEAFLRNTGARHINHPSNGGAAANFNFLWGSSRAPFRLFLADDDWIDNSYISQCFEYMLRHKCSQVAGQALHYADGIAIGKDSGYQLLGGYPLIRLHVFCNTVTTSNGIFYGLRTPQNYFFTREQGSDFCDTYFSILTGKLAVITTTHIHRDFSNWIGAKAAEASADVYQELRVGADTIPTHSALAFFSVASAIRYFLYCDWNLACAFAFLVCPKNIYLDVGKLLHHLHTNQNPFSFLRANQSIFSQFDVNLQSGLLKVLHGLLCINPTAPGYFLVSREKLKTFSGMNSVQLLDFFGAYNDFLCAQNNVLFTEIRNQYTEQVKRTT